jgi:hypothetical protein
VNTGGEGGGFLLSATCLLGATLPARRAAAEGFGVGALSDAEGAATGGGDGGAEDADAGAAAAGKGGTGTACQAELA